MLNGYILKFPNQKTQQQKSSELTNLIYRNTLVMLVVYSSGSFYFCLSGPLFILNIDKYT